jgi:hypothetical protein
MNAVRGLARMAFAAAILGLVWIVWRPTIAEAPRDFVEVSTAAGLHALAAGEPFLLKGRAYPADDEGARVTWQGRFAYLHKQRRDHGGTGGSSRSIRIETVAERRPTIRFDWADGSWVLPAGSYDLGRAASVRPRFWPRKWFWTTRVDDWDPSSTGIRAGETVWARGYARSPGTPVVTELWGDPWEPLLAREAAGAGMRRWLILAAKIAASAVALSVIAPLWRRPDRTAL